MRIGCSSQGRRLRGWQIGAAQLLPRCACLIQEWERDQKLDCGALAIPGSLAHHPDGQAAPGTWKTWMPPALGGRGHRPCSGSQGAQGFCSRCTHSQPEGLGKVCAAHVGMRVGSQEGATHNRQAKALRLIGRDQIRTMARRGHQGLRCGWELE